MRDPSPGAAVRRGAIPPLLAALLVAVPYVPALGMGLFGDDFELLDASFRAFGNPLQLLDQTGQFFRPLVKLSLLADWSIWGPQPVAFNLVTLLIHVVNVGLLAVLVRRIAGRGWFGFTVALLWGCSSLISEVTLWASSRGDSLLVGFVLGVMIIAAGPAIEHPRGRWLVLALAACAAGSKETWIVLPPLLTAFLALLRRWHWHSVLTATIGPWLLLAAYLVSFFGIPLLSASGSSPTSYLAATGIAFMVTKTAFVLARFAGLGGGFVGAAWEVLAVAAGLAGAIATACWLRDRLALWGLTWMLLCLLPTIPIQYTPSRYNYLPLIGFWLATTAIAASLARRARTRKLIGPHALAVVATIAVLAVVAVDAARVHLEIRDYQRLAAAHSQLVAMLEPVLPLLDGRQPVVLVDEGRRRPIAEVEATREGSEKLLFRRNDGLWQLIRLAPLVNVLGEPHRRLLVRVPDAELGTILASDPLVLLFADAGFSVGGAYAATQLAALLDAPSGAPPGVTAYRWTTHS